MATLPRGPPSWRLASPFSPLLRPKIHLSILDWTLSPHLTGDSLTNSTPSHHLHCRHTVHVPFISYLEQRSSLPPRPLFCPYPLQIPTRMFFQNMSSITPPSDSLKLPNIYFFSLQTVGVSPSVKWGQSCSPHGSVNEMRHFGKF